MKFLLRANETNQMVSLCRDTAVAGATICPLLDSDGWPLTTYCSFRAEHCPICTEQAPSDRDVAVVPFFVRVSAGHECASYEGRLPCLAMGRSEVVGFVFRALVRAVCLVS